MLLFNDRSFSVQPPANKTEDRTNAKKAFISTIKSKVESTTGLKLLPVYDEEKKHKTRGLILANQMNRSEDSSNLTGAKYLGFFSSRSLKTREKYISFLTYTANIYDRITMELQPIIVPLLYFAVMFLYN